MQSSRAERGPNSTQTWLRCLHRLTARKPGLERWPATAPMCSLQRAACAWHPTRRDCSCRLLDASAGLNCIDIERIGAESQGSPNPATGHNRSVTPEALVTLTTEFLLLAVFVGATVSALRSRDPLARDVVLIFGAFVPIVLVGLASGGLGTLPPVVTYGLAA